MTKRQPQNQTPAFCNYDNSTYQEDFWGGGKRAYEDAAEAMALARLLPESGKLMLEIGAGAGRNTLRYEGYERIVVLDYALTQVQQARQRLGASPRFIYVAADVYRLPFVNELFDGATMIRVVHHLSQLDPAFAEIQRVMQTHSTLILEYANKRNLKAILRWLTGKQKWNPFSREMVEFATLNFDNHPGTVEAVLRKNAFAVEKALSVSSLRVSGLKSNPANLNWMMKLESILQYLGAGVKLSPSVFLRCRSIETKTKSRFDQFFICPNCRSYSLTHLLNKEVCQSCGYEYPIVDGVYDFRVIPADQNRAA